MKQMRVANSEYRIVSVLVLLFAIRLFPGTTSLLERKPRRCGGAQVGAYPVFGPKKLDPKKIIAQMTANTPIARTGTMIPSTIEPSQ